MTSIPESGAAGAPAEAEALDHRLLMLAATDVERTFALGLRGVECGRLDFAADAFAQAARLMPEAAAIHYNLGWVLQQLQRNAESERAYRNALDCDPDYLDALSNLVIVLRRQGRLDEALRAGQLAVQLRPNDGDSHFNLAMVEIELERFDAAERSLRSVLATRQTAGDWFALGNALYAQRRAGEAIAAFDAALRGDPQNHGMHWNRGLALLLAGNLPAGFADYEWRMRNPGTTWVYRSRGAPEWRGEPVRGRTLLLYGEQGIGDMIQFVRFAADLRAAGATLIFEVPHVLHRLFATSFTDVRLVDIGEPAGPIDFACPLMSLPARLPGFAGPAPAPVRYLCAPAEAGAVWRDRLAGESRPKIGLVWSGNPRPEDADAARWDRMRSLALADLAPLLDDPEVCWVSLQKGAGETELRSSRWHARICDWSDELTDFAATAGLIEALDLVITVDTSLVHLAGALGRPVWLMCCYNGCWRWQLDREDSPWYPTARIYRQRQRGAWGDVVRRIGDDIRTKRFASAAANRSG